MQSPQEKYKEKLSERHIAAIIFWFFFIAYPLMRSWSDNSGQLVLKLLEYFCLGMIFAAVIGWWVAMEECRESKCRITGEKYEPQISFDWSKKS